MKTIFQLLLPVELALGMVLTFDAIPQKQDKLKSVQEAASLDGYWEAVGKDGSKVYSCMVSIKQMGTVYVFHWHMAKAFIGAGIRRGDEIVVGWSTPQGEIRGCHLYQIRGKKLVGRWASLPGKSEPQDEELVFVKSFREEEP